MKLLYGLSALIAVALPAVALCATPVAPAHAAARTPTRDWSKVATRLPSGAFVQGNPDARIKLVEYLSLTCPHCAKFEGEAITPLTAKYIRTGLVSYEVRHALRDAIDFAGSLLVRCDGPQAFFTTLPTVFAQQLTWFGRAQQWAQTAPDDKEAPDILMPKVAAGAGFDTLLGFAPAKMTACLTNHDEQAVLTAMASEAWKRPAFPGTPAFLINGKLAEGVLSWPELDAALAAALKSSALPRKTRRS